MTEVEKSDTARVAAKMTVMFKALKTIRTEAAAAKDDTGCVGAGRRLERIHRAAQAALDAYRGTD